MDAGTLIPGTCRQEECDFFVFFNECIANARGQPLQFSAAKLLVVSQAVGYDAALHAAVITLSVLKSITNAWPESEDRGIRPICS